MTLLPSLKPAPQDVTPVKPPAAQQKQSAKGKTAAAPPVTPSRLDWQQYMGGKVGKGSASKKPAVPVDADLLTWPYADLQTGNDMPGESFVSMTGYCSILLLLTTALAFKTHTCTLPLLLLECNANQYTAAALQKLHHICSYTNTIIEPMYFGSILMAPRQMQQLLQP